jgi:hypothetical protein
MRTLAMTMCAHTRETTGMRASAGRLRPLSGKATWASLATLVILLVTGMPAAAGADTQSAQGPVAQDTGGCSLALTPSSGPVGTLVSITGSTATCQDGGEGGEFGFFDEYAAVAITNLPAAGPFSFTFRIPVTMASGQFDSAVLGYEGGGPVGPGPAGFLTNMGAPLDAAFDVTSAPPGWADYTSILATTTVCNGCTTSSPVYDLVRSDGFLDTFGPAIPVGNAGNQALGGAIVGSASTADAGGYWLVGADGGVFSFGDAGFYGSLGGVRLSQPIVGMAATTTGHGYWLVGADGGVFSFGDAGFYGSLPAEHVTPDEPIVGMAPTPDGTGYWLVGADGGVFSFGDALFYGSMAGKSLHAPVVAMAATPSGRGYWLAAGDGGVFTFGDAPFEGSAAADSSQFATVAMSATSSGQGYWLLSQDGGVFTFGDATFLGSGRGGPGQGTPTS